MQTNNYVIYLTVQLR